MDAPINKDPPADECQGARRPMRPRGRPRGGAAGTTPSGRPRSQHPRALLTLDPEPARRIAGAGAAGRGTSRAKHGRRVTELDQVIGGRIRAVRSVRGVSQTDLGKHLGITFQQIQKYETGSNRISAATLARVAAILAVPADLLLRDLNHADLDVSAVVPDAMKRFGEEALLLELFRSLRDASWRMRVLEFVELLHLAERRSHGKS